MLIDLKAFHFTGNYTKLILRSASLFIMFFCSPLLAQDDFPDFDEFTINMNISNFGDVEIPVAIKNEDAYIDIISLFNILKVKHEVNQQVISGFIFSPDDAYTINYENFSINFDGNDYQLTDNDFIITPTSTYLKSNHFGEILNLPINFSFRNLSLKLNTSRELPIIKEMRLSKMRENLDRAKGVIIADTTIEKKYPFFKGGMLDWGVITTQQTNFENDNRLTLGLGTMFLGGETNLLLNYSTRVPFDSRNQFYQWRYVNNDNSVFKQVTAGRILTRATSSLFAPVSGIQVSNSPLQNRKSFGSYVLNDYTEPRWVVELYVNNALISYTEADASGFYSFEVPLMYGNTIVNLRFYGPYGEERVEQRTLNIPYNFVPKNEFEYTLSAGIVENEFGSKFSRLNLNYGISNGVTLGGGVEYLEGVTSGEFMPFINSSFRLGNRILFSGEYMYGVKGEGILSYRSSKNLQLDLNYAVYDEEQTAINFNYLEERKLSLTTPVRTPYFNMFSRFSMSQIIMPNASFVTAQLLLSGSLMGVSTNFTTFGIYNDRLRRPTIYSTLSQTYRLPNQFLFSPQIQYDFSATKFNNIILEFERPVFEKGFFNVAYENNLLLNAHIFEIGLRYMFEFAQTASNSRFSNRNSTFVQSARGSFLLDDNTGFVTASNRTAIAKAGLTIQPFLDYNNNGIKDPMEPAVRGLKLKNTYGSTFYNDDQTILRVTDLQPYIDILLEVDPVSLDNIAWKVKNPLIKVETVPNQFKEILIPIEVLGEVAGMVYLRKDGNVRSISRIKVNIFDENNTIVKSILSENDGYFTYLGLQPGKYTARIDEAQLSNLNLSSEQEIDFEIKIDQYGDIVDTLEFILE